MSTQKVLIKSLSKERNSKVLTSEGTKKYNDKGEIEVSLELALSLVDDVNWSCKEDLKKLSKKFGLDKEKKWNNIEESDEENEDHEENDEVEESEEEVEEESEDMGDEDIRQLIKKIPTMEFLDLKEAAEDAGIDTTDFRKKDRLKLAKLLIRTLKGKN